MKKVLMLVAILASCTVKNEQPTIDWIKQAEKPIVAKRTLINAVTGSATYTLLSSDFEVYNTGWVHLNLPDTIK